MYISIIGNISGPTIIKTTRVTVTAEDNNNKKIYNYTLDSEVIKHHLRLNKFKNKKCTNFDEHIKVLFDIKDEQENIVDAFAEDITNDT